MEKLPLGHCQCRVHTWHKLEPNLIKSRLTEASASMALNLYKSCHHPSLVLEIFSLETPSAQLADTVAPPDSPGCVQGAPGTDSESRRFPAVSYDYQIATALGKWWLLSTYLGWSW